MVRGHHPVLGGGPLARAKPRVRAPVRLDGAVALAEKILSQRDGGPFFWRMPRWASSVSRRLRPPRPPAKRVVNTRPLSVSTEAGKPWSAPAVRKVWSTEWPVTVGGR